MLIYPDLDPIALTLGPLKIHWYGLMYLFGFMACWGLGVLRARRADNPMTSERVSDCIFYGALGVILGGRLGYVLFYNLPFYATHPWDIFAIWDGGMSFHGGLIGVVIAYWILSRRFECKLLSVTDFFAPMVPIGLGAGRIGNFINDELWGRVTDSPLGMIFPTGGPLPRYPSQLIEFLLEGVLLFAVLWILSRKPRPLGWISAWFLMGYGAFRCIGEFFREPDPQIGFIGFGWLTEGQLLCIPMIVIGIYMYRWSLARVKRLSV